MENANKYFGMYYAIMNILDYLALNEVSADKEEDLYKVLDILRTSDPLHGSDSELDYISSLADANDCGNCTTWTEVIDRLRENYESGNRI